MRKFAELSLVLAILLLAAPVLSGIGREKLPSLQNISLDKIPQISISELADRIKCDDKNDDGGPVKVETVSVKNIATGEVFEVSLRDYVLGVVACEMPMHYADEALRAQAVACRTYLSYYKENRGGVIPTTAQGFITVDGMKTKWGDDFDVNYPRLCGLVDSVEGRIIKYDGKPILAAYHAISHGETEDARNVWGEAMPCLVPVDSSADKTADGYRTGANFTREQFADAALRAFSVDIGDVPLSELITDINKSASGTVLSAKICGAEVSGGSIRSAFGLRSADFDVSAVGDRVFFIVTGYGHGVGMSQNGANEMAKSGCDYREILEHY
ncbi:MAG: SpoIID/LytB domain-containing protein, partial [Oscillospiraceae bacterium]|nr:SpoIID/LytB domain-containing protein [Oscillospiraceae bacterium]